MSASPAAPSPSGGSDGRTPTTTNGLPKFIRRPKPADPLRQHSRRPPPRAAQGIKAAGPRQNGLKPLAAISTAKSPNGRPTSQPQVAQSTPANSTLRQGPGGFSETPTGDYSDYPLLTTKRALREGLRYHIARFTAKKDIDPTNQDEFVRPVSLHRRDPRQPPPGKPVKDEILGPPIDDKERERLEIAKLEKEAQRAADLAQIAPSGNNAAAMAAKKHQSFRNEKTTQVHRLDKTEEQKKESDLRYEEALPWHLEDAENKHTWVGNYEAALSDTNVLLVIDGTSFKMIPVEKWYKFTPKNQFKTLTAEEAEAQMVKKSRPSRWMMQSEEKEKRHQENQATRHFLGNLYKVKGESSTYKQAGKRETQDADDLDYEGDLFEDDDEQATVEPDNDEDTKTAADKIKREQLGANLFGEGDEHEVEKEAKEEEKEEEMKKEFGKTTKKALRKREKNYLYESDSSHPYSSTSEDDTSDDEKQKEADRKKDEEAKLKAKVAVKPPSGIPSKGSTTPSGRPKHSDPLKKMHNLKRPGSPNLSASETSGNESSRKKHKKKHFESSSQPSGTSAPIPSRPMSPVPSASQPLPGSQGRTTSVIGNSMSANKSAEVQPSTPNASQLSDGDATMGEMSDGAAKAQKKKLKLRLGGGASPNGSRAGSPAVGSRAGSPAAPAQSQNPSSSASLPATTSRPISAAEIAAAIPPEGISISDMLKVFSGRIKDGGRDKDDRASFIRMVRENGDYSAKDKLLRPKKA